jgi:hypothetical protein
VELDATQQDQPLGDAPTGDGANDPAAPALQIEPVHARRTRRLLLIVVVVGAGLFAFLGPAGAAEQIDHALFVSPNGGCGGG